MKNLRLFFQNNIPIVFFLFAVLIFFYPAIKSGKLPIPADTIVGMYHPFRDIIWDGYTAGVPFKNFLITDPVRQQYPWRLLSLDALKNRELPLWNPYSFSGTPLLANFQTAAFYPLNILFFILPPAFSWSVLVFLEPLLAGIFFYSYTRFLNVGKTGSLIGSLAFAFSGFSIAWLEWNTIIHTLLWLPLLLLSVEKLVRKPHLKWSLVFVFALVSSFFAGHLQVFFYSFLLTFFYITTKIITLSQKRFMLISLFFILTSLFFILTSIQWIPTLQYISYSARFFDQGSYTKEGWFIPWQNLIQFIVPDFFGNPATNNYWGVWNYGEFTGYVGLLPLILSIFALAFTKGRKVLFFGSCLFAALLFALPSALSRIPYILNIPFISTSQPTRLLSIVVFCLSILSSIGFDSLLQRREKKEIKKQIMSLLAIFLLFMLLLWIIVMERSVLFRDINLIHHLSISQRNLLLPTALLILSAVTVLALTITSKRQIIKLATYLIVFITVVDLFRFGWKFTSFSPSRWLYPDTEITDYLKSHIGNNRFLALDRRIMPPNFSVMYKLQDISGYDPLYIRWYGEFVTSWDRGKPDITPASFNRIITPTNIGSNFTNLLGIKYILSLNDRTEKSLKLIKMVGETRIYKNKDVFTRTFLLSKVLRSYGDQDEINTLYENIDSLDKIATAQERISIDEQIITESETASIESYSPNHIKIETNTKAKRLLVLSDIYYPSWKVYVDGKIDKIYRVDFILRGVIVDKGKHLVEFKNRLL